MLAWDRQTSEPLGPVITWLSRRTADECTKLLKEGHEPTVSERTGISISAAIGDSHVALFGHGAFESGD